MPAVRHHATKLAWPFMQACALIGRHSDARVAESMLTLAAT